MAVQKDEKEESKSKKKENNTVSWSRKRRQIKNKNREEEVCHDDVGDLKAKKDRFIEGKSVYIVYHEEEEKEE